MERVCSDCEKPLLFAKEISSCAYCSKSFCSKHSKQGPKHVKVCRKCFVKVIKKKVLQEYSENPLTLAKELRSLKTCKFSSKQKLEKKENSIKTLRCQLNFIKVCHKDFMKTMEERLEITVSSNNSLELAGNSLAKAKLELSQCLSLKEKELKNTLEVMEKLNNEKNSLEIDLLRIEKLCESVLVNSKLSLPFSKIKNFCCQKCLLTVKKQFRKQSTSSVVSRASSADRMSAKSLPSYPSDSCKCFLM